MDQLLHQTNPHSIKSFTAFAATNLSELVAKIMSVNIAAESGQLIVFFDSFVSVRLNIFPYQAVILKD